MGTNGNDNFSDPPYRPTTITNPPFFTNERPRSEVSGLPTKVAPQDSPLLHQMTLPGELVCAALGSQRLGQMPLQSPKNPSCRTHRAQRRGRRAF